jgi:hypothetical protein
MILGKNIQILAELKIKTKFDKNLKITGFTENQKNRHFQPKSQMVE